MVNRTIEAPQAIFQGWVVLWVLYKHVICFWVHRRLGIVVRHQDNYAQVKGFQNCIPLASSCTRPHWSVVGQSTVLSVPMPCDSFIVQLTMHFPYAT